MTTKDLTKEVATRLDYTQRDVKEVIETTFDVIKGFMSEGQDVKINHFGTFTNQVRLAHKGYNPITGERIDVKENRIPKFRAGSELKNAVSNK